MKEKQKRPLGPLERLGFMVYRGRMASHKPTRRDPLYVSDLINSGVRKWNRIIAREVAVNNQGTLYLPQVGLERYGAYPIHVEGEGNIPAEGSIILAMNHYNQGPDTGIWTSPVVAKVIAERIEYGWERRYRFTIKSQFSIEPREGDGPVKSRLKKIAAPYVNPRATHILTNYGEASDCIQVGAENAYEEIRKTIVDGHVLCVYPSGIDEYELNEGIPDVGILFKLGIRHDATILPIGVLHKGRHLFINIGYPIDHGISRLNKQSLVDHVMIKIAELLPPQMHGFYAGKV